MSLVFTRAPLVPKKWEDGSEVVVGSVTDLKLKMESIHDLTSNHGRDVMGDEY